MRRLRHRKMPNACRFLAVFGLRTSFGAAAIGPRLLRFEIKEVWRRIWDRKRDRICPVSTMAGRKGWQEGLAGRPGRKGWQEGLAGRPGKGHSTASDIGSPAGGWGCVREPPLTTTSPWGRATGFLGQERVSVGGFVHVQSVERVVSLYSGGFLVVQQLGPGEGTVNNSAIGRKYYGAPDVLGRLSGRRKAQDVRLAMFETVAV